MKKGEMSIQQMKSPSRSLQRLQYSGCVFEPYINLANAIVSVAADDYRTALEENNAELQRSLERFFYSNWYSVLTKVEPDAILDRIKREFTAKQAIAVQ